MAENKNQHYVPQFYFKKFSTDGKTICLFNLKSRRFVKLAPIKGLCSKNYFYSKNTQIEKEFSFLEGLGNKLISKILKNQNISCLNEEEILNLKSHILFQRGRTEYARDAEEETANALFNMLKPNFLQYAKKEGLKITEEEVNKIKIKSNSKNSLLISMMSGPLLYDLSMILLENKTSIDFIFSDNPVVFFNSFFNEKTEQGTQGIASTGLQIYFPINSKFALFIFDPNFYEIKNVKIKNELDIQRLNGLQMIYCNENIYFENTRMQRPLLLRYNQLKSKRPSQKTTNRVVANRIAEDGTYRELWRTSSTKIKYNLEKLSFLKHKKTEIPYGIRNPKLVGLHNKIMRAVEKGEIRSQEDMEKFFNSF